MISKPHSMPLEKGRLAMSSRRASPATDGGARLAAVLATGCQACEHALHILRNKYAHESKVFSSESLEITMTKAETTGKYGKMLPMQWNYSIAGHTTIVVQFPLEFPFKRPVYFVRTRGKPMQVFSEGELVEVKAYLLYATMNEDKSVNPKMLKEHKHVEEAESMLYPKDYNPFSHVSEYVDALMEDKTLFSLLKGASTWSMSDTMRHPETLTRRQK